MEEKKPDSAQEAAPKPGQKQEQESQGVIVEIFKKLLEYNFSSYGTKKEF